MLQTASKELMRIMDVRANLFHLVVTQCNRALSDLNLLRVKTAVLRHDSKLCKQNVDKIQEALALNKEDQLKQLIELNQELCPLSFCFVVVVLT